MAQLPDSVRETWEHRNGPAVLTTVSPESVPNAIYVTCIALYDDETVLIADNYFDKTRTNILAGCNGSILYFTDDSKAIQIKGTITYHTSGPIFDHMKSWNPEKHPGHAVAALSIDDVYSGAKKLHP